MINGRVDICQIDASKEFIMKLLEHQEPVRALKDILENYDYLKYDEGGSSSIVKLRVKVKETHLDAERDIAVADHIKKKLTHATGRYYVLIFNPKTGSPLEDNRNKSWTYFTLHEKAPPRQ